MDWRHHAACRGTDPELFFPTGHNGALVAAQTDFAKAICHQCTVAAPCLVWALGTGQAWGVWGGLSPQERRALRGHAPPVEEAI
jgi:WhiB family redox-sensing transcriptional regulator